MEEIVHNYSHVIFEDTEAYLRIRSSGVPGKLGRLHLPEESFIPLCATLSTASAQTANVIISFPEGKHLPVTMSQRIIEQERDFYPLNMQS